MGIVGTWIQFSIKSRQDEKFKKQQEHTEAVRYKVEALAGDTARVVDKVDVIEKHTNGMLTALQNKVEAQQLEKQTTAAATEKDKEIALLKRAEPAEKK
jgi:hypothetical protein